MNEDRLMPHLATEDVAGFVDRSVSVERRVEIENHLAECDACRAEVVAITRMVREKPSTMRPLLLALGLSAAAIFVITVAPLVQDTTVPSPLILRQSEQGEGAGEVEILSPLTGGVFDDVERRLQWRAQEGDAVYRVTITREDGEGIWTASTSGTVLAVADSVALVPGGHYYWWVDALLRGGSIATSGVHEFTMPP